MQKYSKQANYPTNRFKARRFCASFPWSVWALGLLRCLFNIVDVLPLFCSRPWLSVMDCV